jgi:hypothetical protein
MCTGWRRKSANSYDDPTLHPWFPFKDPKFVEQYNKGVDDGEYEGVAGQPRKRVKEHFKCGDLPEFDNRQAATIANAMLDGGLPGSTGSGRPG